jgi:hypothetical protein
VGKYSSIDTHYFHPSPPLHGNVVIGVAYYDGNATALKYTEYDCLFALNCGWHTTTIDNSDLYYDGQYVSMKFDENGHATIAYIAGDSTYTILKLASYVGGGNGNCGKDAALKNQWYCTIIDSVELSSFLAIAHPSVAIDHHNNLRVAYIVYDLRVGYDWNSQLKYAYPILTMGNCGLGQSWQCDVLQPFVYNTPTSLVTDISNQPHLAYNYAIPGNALGYAQPVGSGGNCGPSHVEWFCYGIDTLIPEEDATLPIDVGISLVLDGDQQEHILYYHPQEGSETMMGLFIAQKVGISAISNCGAVINGHQLWHCNAVDPQRRVGKFASAAMKANNLVTVAYYDAVNKTLKTASEYTPVFLPLVSRD